jgi:hypothetical protein
MKTWHWMLVAMAMLVPGMGCQDTTESGVQAINLSTGETRDFPDDGSVPDGWAVCEAGECPDPYPCPALDETFCLVRPDCVPGYVESWPRECESPAPPEYCVGLPYAGCGPAECLPDECGPLPAIARICPDGSTGVPMCARTLDGTCGWDFVCPVPPVCTPEACGPMPLAAVRCADGSVADTLCLPDPTGLCGWQFICGGPPPCMLEECGPEPGTDPGVPPTICDDGSLGGITGACLRDPATGMCGWENRECPPICDPEMCGPPPVMPMIACEDGSPGGFTGRCLPDPAGVCSWETIECPPMCDPTICGPLPEIAMVCPDGSTGEPVCGHDPMTGTCGWHFVCGGPPICDPTMCGPRPGMPSYVCADGSIGGFTGACLPAPDPTLGCVWETRDCPAGCPPEACGPMPGMPMLVCDDGSLGGFTGRCLTDPTTGTCGWEIRDCPADCTPAECGPAPGGDPACPDGMSGAAVCQRDPMGVCGWWFAC